MHKIYIERRCIIICRPDEPCIPGPGSAGARVCEPSDIPHLVEICNEESPFQYLFLITDDVEREYRRVCGEFLEVNAAGGLVSNSRGDCLLIRRNGLWDLPKGHQEPGEDICITALREVREETGVSRLELRGLICITDHCYMRNGIWHLKHTWWYDMVCTGSEDLTPQTEEDISLAAWVTRPSLSAYLTNTYPSITEVFREAKV